MLENVGDPENVMPPNENIAHIALEKEVGT
jgi:hypothetical protein